MGPCKRFTTAKRAQNHIVYDSLTIPYKVPTVFKQERIVYQRSNQTITDNDIGRTAFCNTLLGIHIQ